MTSHGGEWAAAAMAAVALLGLGRAASAAGHRVAAVDPDPQVARALDVALSPWDVTLVEVHLESPGATMPIALDRARSIAQDAGAEVVVWVSSGADGFAVWIYDAASDHASARKLEQSPPFDGPTAAGVALSVKTLLRGTVVAPPPERFGASPGAPLEGRPQSWALPGGRRGLADRAALRRARLGLGAQLGGAAGSRGRARLAPGERRALRDAHGHRREARSCSAMAAVERASRSSPRWAARCIWRGSTAVVVAGATPVSVNRWTQPSSRGSRSILALLGSRLHLAPWIGASVLTRWQRFQVHDVRVLELAPVTLEAALCAAIELP